ncbi:MAG TPA: hypothetical protein VK696_04820 [Steroidobacteraceae bacterium]|jgi:hypothetical protein|nr:hypothetical protein [Steroidobacteraceae bacterium]
MVPIFLRVLMVITGVIYALGPVHGQAPNRTAQANGNPNAEASHPQQPPNPTKDSAASPANSSPAAIPVNPQQSDSKALKDNSGKKQPQEPERIVEIRTVSSPIAVVAPKDKYDWAAYYGNFVLIAVGIAGVIAAICTLKFLRNQVIEMRRQRIEMRRMASLTRRQIALAREEFTTTSRAFVFIDDFNTILHPRETAEGPGQYDFENGQKLDNSLFPGYFSMQPRWKNSGTTETKDMKISVDYGFFDGDPEPDFIGYKEPPKQLFVGGNAVQLSKSIEVGLGPALQVIMFVNGTPLKGGFSRPLLLVWGRADYWDIFGKGHSTEWCYRVGFATSPEKKLIATFTQYGDHNRAYENQKTRPGRDDP